MLTAALKKWMRLLVFETLLLISLLLFSLLFSLPSLIILFIIYFLLLCLYALRSFADKDGKAEKE